MRLTYLKKLTLENYRNFDHFEITASNNPIIIIGENGSGKTNILEAISILFPGRGIRGALFNNICKSGAEQWSASAIIEGKIGLAEIYSNFKTNATKRVLEFNGAKIQANELGKLSSMIWLTPQMEGLFLDSASVRRRFLDRIVYNFEPSHATKVSEYEYYVQERKKVLEQSVTDENWLKIVESKIADVSLVIGNNRINAIEQMQNMIYELPSEFPKAILSIDGGVEAQILSDNSDVAEFIKNQLYTNRLRDKVSERTNFGVHRSDFVIVHQEKNQLAKLCSTGEQKAMLISIMLAQINVCIKITECTPIVLLDELFVHLDDRRKNCLIDCLISKKVQTWVSSTDLNGIEKLAKIGEVVKLT
jgi:DNA replication and repair protein RecF